MSASLTTQGPRTPDGSAMLLHDPSAGPSGTSRAPHPRGPALGARLCVRHPERLTGEGGDLAPQLDSVQFRAAGGLSPVPLPRRGLLIRKGMATPRLQCGWTSWGMDSSRRPGPTSHLTLGRAEPRLSKAQVKV